MKINLHIKGSKSISIRALLLSHLAKIETGKSSKLTNLSDCEDVEVTKKALNKIATKKTKSINLKDCGTAYRFLTALKTITDSKIEIEGSKKLLSRPIKDLEKAITKIKKTGKAEIRGDISSQFISAVLITAPLLKKTIELKVKRPIFSKPYINMTIELMKKFGIKVSNKTSQKFEIFTIKKGQKYKPANLAIEPDATSLSYIIALMWLKGKSHKETMPILQKIQETHLQKDIIFPKLIKEKIATKNTKATTIDMNETPDLVPTIAVLAACREGKTKIINIAHLKFKESDRISALAENLSKIGIEVKSGKSFLEITGNPKLKIKHTVIDPRGDHRIAMAFGVLSVINTSIKIKNPEVVKKSYPKFWQDITNIA